MQHPFATCVLAVGVLLGTALSGHAERITLVEKSIGDLLGSGSVGVDSPLKTTMNDGTLYGEVYSRAYRGNGLYLYLYQIRNTGTVGASSVERFTLGRFAGSVTAGNIGYLSDLSGSLLTDFLPDGQTPDIGTVSGTDTGLDIGFRYDHKPIAPTSHSCVMFIRSSLSPGLVRGNVIDGCVATGDVIGAVSTPEPSTLALFATGGLAFWAYAWRRRHN